LAGFFIGQHFGCLFYMLRNSPFFFPKSALWRREILDVLSSAMKGFDRLKTANNFVLSLSAGVIALYATADGKLDTGVVAKLKMQVGKLSGTAPVASIQRFIIKKVQRTGYRLSSSQATAIAICSGMVRAI